MRSLISKRVFGVVAASSLVAASAVSLAASSEAATAKYKVDATTSVGQTITITGKDFTDDNGAPLFDVTGIRFTSTTCAATKPTAAATNAAGTGPVSAVAVSDTKITTATTGFTPTLTAGKAKYTVCVYDNAADLLGSASTTFYAPPATVTAGVATLVAAKLTVGSTIITNGNYAASLKGSSLGGTKITAKGLDFTSKSYLTVGGKKLLTSKTTLGKTSSDDDVITGLTAPGTNTAAPIKIVGEFGSFPLGVAAVNSGAALNLAYTPTITVSPSGSDGTVGRVLTLTGTGFDDLTLAAAAGTGTAGGKSLIYILPVGINLSTALLDSGPDSAAVTGGYICASPKVNSDTEITCALPTGGIAVQGGYNVVLATFAGAGGAQTVASNTSYSRGSAYTVAPF